MVSPKARTAPFQRLDAERLAAGADAAQIERVAALRVRRRAHHAQRGRRDEGIAHAGLCHQREGFFRVELLALVRHHRHAVKEARQHHVEQAAGPGPVGRRPEAVAFLRERKVRQLDAGHVAEQHAMAVQRALGIAGGARGVDHHRRIVGAGIDRRELRRRARQRFGEIESALTHAVDRQHAGKLGHLGAHLVELGEPGCISQHRPGAGILQAIGERIRTEQDGDGQRHRAELVDRDVRDGDFRRLRHEDGDAVAARDAVGGQHIGEPIGGLAQVSEADLVVPAVGPHMQNGEPARIGRRPAVADVDADIEPRRRRPAEGAIDGIVCIELGQYRHGGANLVSKAGQVQRQSPGPKSNGKIRFIIRPETSRQSRITRRVTR